ncbi:LAME_0B07998g1_1 [Lachancea meyersii CBS 8951]|uniref:Autophagy-related protein 2 n=1 Tax=Lachancea meyersii CBS 8951 TaxID=1266667 RepID=A0A1G4IXL8_9SACH|nr:LAME_0B07998g1_1 [Lachancea meyersii CBS 8951]
MASWFTHNLQRRLLLYLLQKVSLFSQIDIAALDVSLGSSSHFTFHDLDLDVDSIEIPDVTIRSGFLKQLELQLTVSGGLSVEGSGVAFVVKPNLSKALDAQASSFSLTKTVYDLTSSVMQLYEGKDGLLDEDSITDDNTSETDSRGNESDSQSAPTMLQAMRNKALDLILSKLSMTLRDISVKFLFPEDNIIELTIGEIICISADETRQINIGHLSVRHFKKPRKGEENGSMSKAEPSMSESLVYSKLEATSIYMSAIQSLQEVGKPDLPVADQIQGSDLLTIDEVTISFKGFTSVDDIAMREAAIGFENCSIYLHRLLELKDKVIIPLINLLMSQPKKSTSKSDSKTPQHLYGYKRFREEQNLHDDQQFSTLRGTMLMIHLSDALNLTINGMSTSLDERRVIQFSLEGIYLSCDESVLFEVDHSIDLPIIQASYDTTEECIAVKINGDIILDLAAESACELFRTFLSLKRSIDVLRQNLPKPAKKTGDVTRHPAFQVDGALLKASLRFASFSLILSASKYSVSLPSTLFSCDTVLLVMEQSNEMMDLMKLSRIGVKCFPGPAQRSAYNHSFEEVMISFKCNASVREVKLYATAETLKIISKEVEDFRAKVSLVSADYGLGKTIRVKSQRHMRRSVKIMGSSSFINKPSSAVKFLLEIGAIEGCLDSILQASFGKLEASMNDCLVYFNDDQTFTGYAKRFNVKRAAEGKSEMIMNTDAQEKCPIPVLTFHRKLTGKMCCALRKIGFYYFARWLDFVQQPPESNSRPPNCPAKIADNYASVLEIKLIECAVHLNPYRLKARMLFIIGKCAMELTIPNMNMKGVFRNTSILLIDDVDNFKPRPSPQESIHLTSYYTDRGFANVGKLDKCQFSTRKLDESLKITVDMGTVSLSLCADSMQTLTQVSVDLGIPVSFPDAEKYRTKPSHVEVFDGVDEDYFTERKLQLDPSARNVGVVQSMDDFVDPFLNDIRDSGNFIDVSAASSAADEMVSITGAQDNYFSRKSQPTNSKSSNDVSKISVILSLTLERATLKLYDGFDWTYTRKSISDLINQVETALQHQSPSRSETVKASVFDSIYLFAGADVEPGMLRQQINKDLQTEASISINSSKKLRLRPSTSYKLRVDASGIKTNVLRYNVDNPTESTSDVSADILNDITLSVEDFEIIDNIPTSTWNKVATYWKSEPRPKGSDMISVWLKTVKPIDFLAATELILKVKILPLRLHIDQDALDFLVRFFEFKDSRFDLIDEYPDFVYIQKLEVESVKIKMDYKPKSVDYSVLKSGHKSEFMNFFILEGSELQLRHLIVYGVNGFPELNKILNGIWVPDITSRQLKGILGGVAPMKTMVTLGTGIKALVSTPIKEYKRDQNLGRGLQKGTQVFIRITAGEFVRLGVKLASGTQAMLENVEEVMGGEGAQARNYKLKDVDFEVISEKTFKKYEKLLGGRNPKDYNQEPEALLVEPGATERDAPRIFSLYADQPASLKQGLKEAQGSFGKNVTLAYEAVLKAQHDIKENSNAQERASTVARVIPVALLRPIIGATEALSKALQGVSNEINEEQISMLKDKYKSRN